MYVFVCTLYVYLSLYVCMHVFIFVCIFIFVCMYVFMCTLYVYVYWIIMSVNDRLLQGSAVLFFIHFDKFILILLFSLCTNNTTTVGQSKGGGKSPVLVPLQRRLRRVPVLPLAHIW